MGLLSIHGGAFARTAYSRADDYIVIAVGVQQCVQAGLESSSQRDQGRLLGLELFGPLATEGGKLLELFSDAELARIRTFLEQATSLVEEQQRQVRYQQSGSTSRPKD